MFKKSGFSNYAKPLCCAIAVIWLLVALFVLTGSDDNSLLNGLMWLAGAGAFAIAAIYSPKPTQPQEGIHKARNG